ncbi:hypothetical protein ABH942_002626 [Flavobacterium sp. 28YEA47A]|uniref:hypothetical protein n=1 Tax=Flavobacterium sp. 28YEA47A TaxID=3156276 RepID=UPI003515A341
MSPKIILFFSLFLLYSCKKEVEIQNNSEQNQSIETIETSIVRPEKIFRFENFPIEKGQLGPIKVGSSLEEAEEQLTELTRKRCDPFDFGYDGGGDAFIYYWKDQPILALIPERDSNTLLAIAAIHKKLKTNKGLHPEATIKDILELDDNLPLYQNHMMSWESMFNEKMNWEFIFMKDAEHQVGTYENMNSPGKVADYNAKIDWITIR